MNRTSQTGACGALITARPDATPPQPQPARRHTARAMPPMHGRPMCDRVGGPSPSPDPAPGPHTAGSVAIHRTRVASPYSTACCTSVWPRIPGWLKPGVSRVIPSRAPRRIVAGLRVCISWCELFGPVRFPYHTHAPSVPSAWLAAPSLGVIPGRNVLLTIASGSGVGVRFRLSAACISGDGAAAPTHMNLLHAGEYYCTGYGLWAMGYGFLPLIPSRPRVTSSTARYASRRRPYPYPYSWICLHV
jgi:hypothetical protein